MSAPSVSLNAGDVLAGKYRILRLLGRGGMGAVFAAEHQILGQEVAIKLLLDSPAQGSDLIQRFVNEARAASKIQGEHVVRVFDVDTLPDGNLFIAMELLQGEDLDSLVERSGTLQPSVAVDYVLQSMEALAHAHQLGIVHRDLRPSNLFLVVRPDGEHVIKVLDFGVAKVQNLPNVQGASTQTTALFGTPLYMSPEQIRSAKAADAQSDLWSLGVILFKLLTGNLPFSGETFGELCFSIAEQTAPLAHTLGPGIPPGLSDVVARCLERSNEKRFMTAGELAVALRPFASEGGARSADRVVATERGGGSSAVPPPTEAPAVSGEPAPTPAAPSPPTAGNWAASQARTRGSGAFRKGVAAVVAATAALAAVGIGLVVRATDQKTQPAAAATSVSPPARSAPAQSAPATTEPEPAASAPETPASAAPSAQSSAAPAPSTAPVASRANPARSSPVPHASRPTHTPAPAPHHAAKPASSGTGIVTNMDWN